MCLAIPGQIVEWVDEDLHIAKAQVANVCRNVNVGLLAETEDSIGIGDWITGLRISVTGQNLLLITDYDGYDPEVNIDRTIGGVSSYGIDYLSYPKAKTILFGLNVSF